MTDVLVNAGGARQGGGGTWVLAVAEELARNGPRGLRWHLLVGEPLVEPIRSTGARNLTVEALPALGAATRIAWEQYALTRRRADVLLAGASFVPLARHGPIVLVVHNALHFTGPFVRGRRGARMTVEGWLAARSVARATKLVAPTAAMAELVAERTGRAATVLPFGPGLVNGAVPPVTPPFVFAHRTHWGPHKRFTDLLAAIRLLANDRAGAFVVETACDPTTPFARDHVESVPERIALADTLVHRHVRMTAFPLGSPAQRTLSANAVVLPSAIESFSFPLAEAIASGLPVVAADTALARELCGEAAWYYAPGDAEALARAMRRLLDGGRPPIAPQARRDRLAWSAHVDGLADLIREASRRGRSGIPTVC